MTDHISAASASAAASIRPHRAIDPLPSRANPYKLTNRLAQEHFQKDRSPRHPDFVISEDICEVPWATSFNWGSPFISGSYSRARALYSD